MTNILDRAEFENEIKQMSDRQLSEFTARSVLSLQGTVETCQLRDEDHEKRLIDIEAKDRKVSVKSTLGSGGLGGAIATGLVLLIEYVKGRV